MASAIIVAAGSGLRMKSARPKQYLELAGLPVLTRTLMVFDDHPGIENIFLVVSPGEIEFCREKILSKARWEKEIILVPGGKERQDSVYEGLKAAGGYMEDDDIILIHDGVRPLVAQELITACIACAEKSGACIPGIPASDTLKQVNSDGMIVSTVSRENIWFAQTPQAFSLKRIREGFEYAFANRLSLTDDAAVLEMYGLPVRMIPGKRNNIKITTPEDLHIAAALLENIEK